MIPEAGRSQYHRREGVGLSARRQTALRYSPELYGFDVFFAASSAFFALSATVSRRVRVGFLLLSFTKKSAHRIVARKSPGSNLQPSTGTFRFSLTFFAKSCTFP